MSGKLSMVCVAAASLGLTASALGEHRSDGGRFGPALSGSQEYGTFGDRRPGSPRGVWGPANYEIRERKVIVPAQYETVDEKVWVEPVYELVTREVWVPAPRRHRHLDLNVGKFSLRFDLPGRGRKHGRRQQRDGYYETVRERVLVHEGHFETIAREVLVRGERVEIVREQIQVSGVYRADSHRHGPTPAYDSSPRGHRRGFKAQTGQRKSKSLRRVSGKVRTGAR